jgi:transcriptional regulator with XRE-family HTH domain
MDIYERVSLLCEEKKISKRQLAIACGMDASAISKWRTKIPTVNNVKKVADYFGVSVDWLTGKSDVRNFEQDVYYTDPDVAEKVQRLSDKQRAVMKAVPDLQPGEVDLLWVMIEQFRNGNE